MVKVYTLGYAQPGAAERLQQLMSEPNTLLIDTRISPKTKFKGWHSDDLKAMWKERYTWAGEYLGNPNAFNGGPLAMVNPVRGINGLLYYLSRGHNLVLLCGCKTYNECHRSHIIDTLQVALAKTQLDVEIVPETVVEAYKCLSIRPPYAEWIAMHDLFVKAGLPPKTIENREWTVKYRGPVLIHSSKKFEDDAVWHWSRRIPGLDQLVPHAKEQHDTMGKILAIADLVDVVEDSDDPWFVGSYGWVFANVRPLLYPIRYRGALGLFDVPGSVVEKALPGQKKSA